MGRETDELMERAEQSTDTLNRQVSDVAGALDDLKERNTELRGLVSRADTVAAVDKVIKKIDEASRVQKQVEEGLMRLARTLPPAEQDSKDLDSKVLKKALKNLIPGWTQKTLADAKNCLKKIQAAVEQAKKKQASFKIAFAQQEKVIVSAAELMQRQKVAIPMIDALEEYCANTLDTVLRQQVQLDRLIAERKAKLAEIQREVDTRRD